MNLLVIDGNSIINRAFYGIKLLTAKDGHFTNAIFGFMNIFLNLVEQTKPECIAVAFDVHAPTFRHKMYTEYKAGRKGMPGELFEQMEPLKTILRAYGCHIVECEGYEADDILGTLSANCGKGNHCYLATGDRDSLQLVSDNVTVLLTTTKMGKTQTVAYTPEVLFDEYGLTPLQMIELKALQGDNSDNIPGVAGIGPKTATELIKKYGNIETVFADIPSLDTTNGVKQKLENGRESALLSKTLGTIIKDAPIEKDINSYVLNKRKDGELLTELAKHELFKIISKLGLKSENGASAKEISLQVNSFTVSDDLELFLSMAKKCKEVYLSYALTDGLIETVTFAINNTVFCFREENVNASFEALAELTEVKLIAFRTKDLYKYFFKSGKELALQVYDISLAAYLLDPNKSEYTESSIALSYNIPTPIVDFMADYSETDKNCISNCAVLPVMYSRLDGLIKDNAQSELLSEIEFPLAKVLADMENTGMAVSKAEIENYSLVLADKILQLEQEIYSLTDCEFNINSPKQLGVVLFEKMSIPAKKKTKTGYSTSADVLEELSQDYPVVNKILEYRTYSKLKSTYCDGLLKAIEEDGRIRSTFNQTETRTGRLSSTEPNLQNIPVRTEVGREFRKFFCAKEGSVIVDADYSQIELRVLAALANDINMINAFNNGDDIHTVTASKVFNLPVEEVSSELRSKAKAVNFGIVYGIGAFSLAKDIKSTRKEAEEFITSYLALYPGVSNYMNGNIEQAKRDGYVTTLFNRRRYLPELTASNAMVRSFGERVARNMPIQGTAADIIKIAMIKVYNRLKEQLPNAKLIMQVHDELLLEAPIGDAELASRILKEEMENAVKMSVKMSVDVGVGKTWYDAKG